MAKETLVRLIDDIDGTVIEDGGTTVVFSLEGRAYEIDLSRENLEKLREVFKPFVSAGRTVGRVPRSVKSARPNPADRHSSSRSSVRAWARDNGFDVGDRGRIPEEVIVAFNNAQQV